MKFQELLSIYENTEEIIKRHFEKGYKSREICKEELSLNLEWFWNMKTFCEDYNNVIEMKNPTKTESKKYKSKNKGCPLCGVIHYRGIDIPVYNDDYGQQMFCILPNGELISGGAYNLWCEYDFCSTYDESILPRL